MTIEKSHRAVRRGGFDNSVLNTSEYIEVDTKKQENIAALLLARRFSMPLATAAVVAGLAGLDREARP